MSWEIVQKGALAAWTQESDTLQYHNLPVLQLRLMQNCTNVPGAKKRLPGRGRHIKCDDSIIVSLKEWVLQKMAMKERVSRESLRQKALELISPHNRNFRASHGWITSFLHHYNINLRKNTCGVVDDATIQGNNCSTVGDHPTYLMTTSANCGPTNAVFDTLTTQEVVSDGLVPVEEDVEIISDIDSRWQHGVLASELFTPLGGSTWAATETVSPQCDSQPLSLSHSALSAPAQHAKGVTSLSRKTKRYDQSLELVLKNWILQRVMMKERVTRRKLQQKAVELISPHNPGFRASQGWISRFLHRYNINLKSVTHGQNKSKQACVFGPQFSELGAGPAVTSMASLQNIGIPRDLLLEDINWKHMMLNIRKEKFDQFVTRTPKRPGSRIEGQIRKKILGGNRKRQSRKTVAIPNHERNIQNKRRHKTGSKAITPHGITKELPNVEQPVFDAPTVCDSNFISEPSTGIAARKLARPFKGKLQKTQLVSKRRKSWDITKKKRLVLQAEKLGIPATAELHDLSYSTLLSWTKQDFTGVAGHRKRLPGGGRSLRYDRSVDLALRRWAVKGMAKNTVKSILRTALRKKAMKMILPYNPNFKASSGWIVSFLARHNLTSKYSNPVQSKKRKNTSVTAAPASKRKKGTV